MNLQDWENRQDEDRLLIERILIIVRNILHVPPNQAKELVRNHGDTTENISNLFGE